MFNVVIELYHISELKSMFIYEIDMKNGGENLYEKFVALLQRNGMTAYRVSKDTGISANTFTDWKNGRSVPKQDKLQKIADYFGVTIEYLMTGNESQQEYYLNEETAKQAQEMYEDSDMRTLFDMKRKMPADRFAAHVKFMKELYEKENPSE